MRRHANMDGVAGSLLSQIDRATGLRLTAACIGPLALGYVAGQPEAGTYAGVGGLWVGLADSGGTYRTRATSLAVTAAGLIACYLLGTAVAPYPVAGLGLVFLFAFAAGMMSVFGNAANTVGSLLLVAYLFAIGTPGTLADARRHVLFQALGAAWAAMLSLRLWPIRPYLPVQEAIAKGYREAARLLRGIERHIAGLDNGAARWSATLAEERAAAAQAIQQARYLTAEIRTRRQGATFLGQDLLILTRYADRLLSATIALAETLDIAMESIAFAHIRGQARNALRLLVEAAERVATATAESGRRIDVTPLRAATAALSDAITRLRNQAAETPAQFAELLHLRHVDRALSRLAACLEAAAEAAATLGKPRRVRAHHGDDAELDPALVGAARLRDNLTFDSLIFRHALRLATACAVGVLAASAFRIDYGAWITLTIAVILKPDFGGTRQRAIQRVAGTVAGGLVGVVLAHSVHHLALILLFLALFCFAAFSQMSLEYHRFVFFLTPFVVLLISLGHHGDWQVGFTRMTNTVGGGAIALAAGYLLWPAWALDSLPAQAARAAAANRAYFRAVMDAFLGERLPAKALRQAQEEAQVENSNVYVSFQRLLADPAHRQASVEPYYALVSYLQRFCDDVTTLHAYLDDFSGRHRLPGLDQFTSEVTTALAQIEAALRDGAPPPPAPSFEDSLSGMTQFVERMLADRAREIAERRTPSSRRQLLRDVAALPAELRRLAEEVVGMALAVRRLQVSSPWLLAGIQAPREPAGKA